MGNLVKKIQCPGGLHEDLIPSCGLYDDGTGYCFSCGSYFSSVHGHIAITKPTEKEKEDLTAKLAYIDTLPIIEHRGLSFPHDNRGYYIVWPNRDYYKIRFWLDKENIGKYMGAKGHIKPWFSILRQSKNCIITEGEVNALSLSKALEWDIISPGGAGNFFDKEMKKNLQYFQKYDKILILADNDNAGQKAVINLHKLIKLYNNKLIIKLLDKGHDANDILIQYGISELRRKILEM